MQNKPKAIHVSGCSSADFAQLFIHLDLFCIPAGVTISFVRVSPSSIKKTFFMFGLLMFRFRFRFSCSGSVDEVDSVSEGSILKFIGGGFQYSFLHSLDFLAGSLEVQG